MPGSWQHNRIHPSLSKFDAIRHVCALNSHYLSAFSNSKTFAQRQPLVTGKSQRESDMSPCPLLPNHLNRIFSSHTRNNVSCLPFKDEWLLELLAMLWEFTHLYQIVLKKKKTRPGCIEKLLWHGPSLTSMKERVLFWQDEAHIVITYHTIWKECANRKQKMPSETQ